MQDFAKWNSKGKEGDALRNLFKSNKVDLTNQRPAYIKEIQKKYPEFQRFKAERFVQNYRKSLNAYLTGESKKGARNRKCLENVDFLY